MEKTHSLKCWPQYFEAVKKREKTFEVRKNDRFFITGDFIELNNWNPITKEYTGEKLFCKIIYVLIGGKFGIEEGYCVLGIQLGVTMLERITNFNQPFTK